MRGQAADALLLCKACIPMLLAMRRGYADRGQRMRRQGAADRRHAIKVTVFLAHSDVSPVPFFVFAFSPTVRGCAAIFWGSFLLSIYPLSHATYVISLPWEGFRRM